MAAKKSSDNGQEEEAVAADLNFERFLQAVQRELPPDLVEQMTAGLRRRFQRPPLADMELCLGRSVPLEKARQLLFYPDADDMALYPSLIAMPPPGAPDNHPQLRVQVAALASLYLVHCKSWQLVQPFVEAGGFSALVAVVSHPNLHIASQAMSIFMSATDEELVFPWFDPPAAPDGRGPRHGPYALAWRRMYELSGTPFVAALLRHYPATFPGSSSMALRLFAFYASWLRHHFAQESVLRLSQPLLELLERWSKDAAVGDDERSLAKQLHEDFGRFPPAEAPADGAQLGAASGHTRGLDPFDVDEASTRVVSERTVINSGPPQGNEAEQLRALGDAACARQDWSGAIQHYSAALDSLVPAERLISEPPRRAAYHVARAEAYLARAQAGLAMRDGDCDGCGHLDGYDLSSPGAAEKHYEAASLDCDMALDMDGACARACLIKSRAQGLLGRRQQAAAAAEAGLGKCGSSGQLADELKGQLAALGSAASTAGAQATARNGGSVSDSAAASATGAGSKAAAGSGGSRPKSQQEQYAAPVHCAANGHNPAAPRQAGGIVRVADATAANAGGSWGAMD